MSRIDQVTALIGERAQRVFIETPATGGNIPVMTATANGLAEAWELSLLALYGHGGEVRTEYDATNDDGQYLDPPSLDASMRIVIEDPLADPMIHRCFPGGLDTLEEYRQEVIDGIKDHWRRDPDDPEDQRWEYTYHERIFNYSVPGLENPFDQIEQVVEGLAKNPHSRRQQAIVWKVWEDTGIHDPACMQSLWFRALPDDDGALRLNMNVRFRSRDAYDAAFMNCFALCHLMDSVRARLAERAGCEVRLGRYVDESDSYHIYGHRLADFQTRFLKQVANRPFDERVWDQEFAEPFFEEARPRIVAKIKQHDDERSKG